MVVSSCDPLPGCAKRSHGRSGSRAEFICWADAAREDTSVKAAMTRKTTVRSCTSAKDLRDMKPPRWNEMDHRGMLPGVLPDGAGRAIQRRRTGQLLFRTEDSVKASGGRVGQLAHTHQQNRGRSIRRFLTGGPVLRGYRVDASQRDVLHKSAACRWLDGTTLQIKFRRVRKTSRTLGAARNQ